VTGFAEVYLRGKKEVLGRATQDKKKKGVKRGKESVINRAEDESRTEGRTYTEIKKGVEGTMMKVGKSGRGFTGKTRVQKCCPGGAESRKRVSMKSSQPRGNGQSKEGRFPKKNTT